MPGISYPNKHFAKFAQVNLAPFNKFFSSQLLLNPKYPLRRFLKMHLVSANLTNSLSHSLHIHQGNGESGNRAIDNFCVCVGGGGGGGGLRNVHRDFSLPHPLLFSHTYLETLVSTVSVYVAAHTQCSK